MGKVSIAKKQASYVALVDTYTGKGIRFFGGVLHCSRFFFNMVKHTIQSSILQLATLMAHFEFFQPLSKKNHHIYDATSQSEDFLSTLQFVIFLVNNAKCHEIHNLFIFSPMVLLDLCLVERTFISNLGMIHMTD